MKAEVRNKIHDNKDECEEKWACLAQLQKKLQSVLLGALCRIEGEGVYFYDDPYWTDQFGERIEQSLFALKECKKEEYKKVVKILKVI